MCRNLNSITGEARWQNEPYLPVQMLSSISQYMNKKTFFLRFETLLTKDMQRRNQPYSDENCQLWCPMKSAKVCFWFEVCLFSFGVWLWGGFFMAFFVLFLQLITFQISAEPSKSRDKTLNVFLERINSFMLLLKGTFLFVLSFQKFPLHQ